MDFNLQIFPIISFKHETYTRNLHAKLIRKTFYMKLFTQNFLH